MALIRPIPSNVKTETITTESLTIAAGATEAYTFTASNEVIGLVDGSANTNYFIFGTPNGNLVTDITGNTITVNIFNRASTSQSGTATITVATK